MAFLRRVLPSPPVSPRLQPLLSTAVRAVSVVQTAELTTEVTAGSAQTMAGKRGRGGQLQAGQGTSSAPQQQQGASAAPASNHVPVALAHQSTLAFQDLPVHPLTKRAMAEVFKYQFCTHVQAQSLPACLTGSDVLAKAKTGTGKTIGFMIPVIETLLARPPGPRSVGALILSPTRELATQIYQEAVKLLTFHKQLSIQVVIGGTNMNTDVRRLQQQVPSILVATPGRCLDHLTNNDSPLRSCMSELRVLVCDEADNLLDMGFRPTIEQILSRIPPKGRRQALLFSATFPTDVQDLARFALQAPWQVVDTVGVETQTNVQVAQYQQVVPFEDIMYYVYAALRQHMADNPTDYKVIIFLPTARQTQLYAETFAATGLNILEIHSRKSQSQRNRVSDEFRTAAKAVLFSSDVSARGVDYPDVSLVMQVGVPSDRAQYVHRVGRTARAGKAGEALLVLAEFEEGFLDKLHDLPVQQAPQLPFESRQQAMQAVETGLARISEKTKEQAYVAWLGFYNTCPMVRMPSVQTVALANRFSQLMRLPEPPELEAKTVGKMGLKGVPGLRVAGKAGGGGGGRGAGPPGGGRGGAAASMPGGASTSAPRAGPSAPAGGNQQQRGGMPQNRSFTSGRQEGAPAPRQQVPGAGSSSSGGPGRGGGRGAGRSGGREGGRGGRGPRPESRGY